MTAHPIAPMTDAEMASIEARMNHAVVGVSMSADQWSALKARLTAAEARANEQCDRVSALIRAGMTLALQLDDEKRARKAAEDERDALKARALPPARLMRTVEDVEGLEPGRYQVRPDWSPDTTVMAPIAGEWWAPGVSLPMVGAALVGATVVGPLPDVEPITEGDAP